MSAFRAEHNLMKLEQFVRGRSGSRNSKYRTLNIDEDLHLFFKQTANHYNLSLSDLVYNVLSHWKIEYEDEIKDDILRRLGS